MTREEATDTICNSSFSEHSEFLISLLRPSAIVHLHDQAEFHESARPRSFFGGQPLLPKDSEWPVWDRSERLWSSIRRWESKIDPAPQFQWMRQMIDQWKEHLDDGPMPLAFLGQLFLDEITCNSPLEHWPISGSLAFFYGDSAIPGNSRADRGHCRVVHVPDNIAASPAAFPTNLENSIRYPKLHATFHREWSLPYEPMDSPSDTCSWMNIKYRELLNALISPAESSQWAHHKCGGHPQIIQGPMEPECQMISENLNWDEYRRLNPEQKSDFNSRAKAWQLLVQFASDKRLRWTWSDVGMVYFWAPVQDISARRFESVTALLQSG